MRRNYSIALMLALSTTTPAFAQVVRVPAPVIPPQALVQVRAVMPQLHGMMPQIEAALAQAQFALPAAEAAMAKLHMSMPQIEAAMIHAQMAMPAMEAALSSVHMNLPVISPRFYSPRFEELQENAQTLFNNAREQMNRENFRRASEIFERLMERFEGSPQAIDAFYWRAFSLHRLNGTDDLEDARDLLQEQIRRYPRASTNAQAQQLLTTVRGELARRGSANDAEATARTATRASQQACAADPDGVREAALNAMLHMNAEQAMPMLKSIMARRDACAAPMRKKAVFLISQQSSREKIPLLLETARNDPDDAVKHDAVFWLSQTGAPEAVDAIEEVLKETSDRKVQEQAIFALSQLNAGRAGQILRAYAQDNARPVEIRDKAIFWLGQKSGAEHGQFLRELYPRLTDQKLKNQVLFAVSQRPEPANARWLMDIALNEQENMELRKQALFWAGQMRGVNLQDFVALYDRTSSMEMKDQLIFVYSQRREDAALLKLIEIAKNDRNPELKKKAIFWLGQSKDPRAVRALAEIIG